MTLLSGWFQGNEAKAAFTAPYDIITSDRILNDIGSMWGSIALDTDYTATYEEIAKRQLWVRIAVNKLAYSIGRISLKTYQRQENASAYVTSAPLPDLLRWPNDSKETGTTEGFLARVAYDLFVYGNALIVKVQTKPDAPVTQLIPYAPLNWRVVDGDYVYRKPRNGQDAPKIPSWRMIHIAEPGPTCSGFGVSRLEAARLTLAIEYAAQKFGVATFQNGARPGGIINVKNLPAGKERQAAVERFKSEVMTRFGGTSKAGLPAVLEGDTTWLPMSHNLDDSAVVEHQLTREEVAALYDIPQPAIGILDEANFASVDMLHVMFYQDTLGWPLSLIESTLNQELVRGVTAYDGQYVEFDLDTVLRGAYTERMAGHQTAINAGIRTRDEVRRLENLPPMADQQPEAGLLALPLNYGVSSAPPGKAAP